MPGLFRAGRAGLAEELGWDLKAFDKAFRELTDLGMVKADFQAKLIWIPNALKHNPPASPNVVRSWDKEFDLLPESLLKREAIGFMHVFVEGMGKGFAEAFRKAFPNVFDKPWSKPTAEPFGSPKAKTYPYQEQEQDSKSPSREGVRLGSTGRESGSGLGTVSGGRDSVENPNGSAEAWLDDDLDEPAHAA